MKAIKAIAEGETNIVIVAGSHEIARWIRNELYKYLRKLKLLDDNINIRIDSNNSMARRGWYHLKDHTL